MKFSLSNISSETSVSDEVTLKVSDEFDSDEVTLKGFDELDSEEVILRGFDDINNVRPNTSFSELELFVITDIF
jgi:hypothetical protein